LLAEWAKSDGPPTRFAWVTLDADDNDQGLFWSYVVEALRGMRPDVVSLAPDLSRLPGVRPLRDVVPGLINDFRNVAEQTVLILDDYHQITTSAIHDAVSYLIDHLPGCLHVVIASRTDPPLPLGRLRAAGELTEIRVAHLGFDEGEARTLLRNTLSLEIEPATVRRLWERTEGWPAGLYLAGLSVRDRADVTGFVEDLAGDSRNIAEYLAEEVLESQEPRRRNFLLRTSILDRLTASLCDAVVGEPGSQAVLQDLETDNLFVIPLDGKRQWFRYHRLFGDWLRHELALREPAAVPELHLRAARWHQEHGSYPRGIDHALAAEDVGLAADLIEEHFWGAGYGERVTTYRLAEIPDEIAMARPRLALARAVDELRHGHVKDAARWLDAAEQEGATEAERVPAVKLLTVRGLYHRITCDVGRAAATATRALEAVGDVSSREYAVAVGQLSSVTFWASGPQAAIPLVRETIRRNERLGLADEGESAALAFFLAEAGDLEQAAIAAQRAFEAVEEVPGSFPTIAAAHYALGRIEAAQGHTEQARDEVARGLSLAEEHGEPLLSAYGNLILADLATDTSSARENLRNARNLIKDLPDPGRLSEWVADRERRFSSRRPAPTERTSYVEKLTERELQVLRYLGGTLSQREIARELYISHNTVKGYVKNIYRKLGVSSRQDALAAARELDLL
jgi:LuxR family maltose regulon positive regulatory protein